jgi:hypothetical protein
MGEYVDIPVILSKEQRMILAQYIDIINDAYRKLEEAEKCYGELRVFGAPDHTWDTGKHHRYAHIITDAELAREHLIAAQEDIHAFDAATRTIAESKAKTFFDSLRERALDKEPVNDYARTLVKKNVLIHEQIQKFLKQPAPRRFL